MSWCETECKICAIGEQNVINEVFILGGQRRERRDGGERGLRTGSRERIEIERKETKGN